MHEIVTSEIPNREIKNKGFAVFYFILYFKFFLVFCFFLVGEQTRGIMGDEVCKW